MARADTGGYARPEMLAETNWLERNLDNPNLRIIDCRNDPDAYYEGHIHRAVYMDYKDTKDKCDECHILTPEQAEKVFGNLGVGDENEVVIYDDVGSYSARVWWTLFHYGHENIRILNGGWKKWVAEGRPVTKEIPRPEFAAFTPRPRKEYLVTYEELLKKLDDPNTIVFDARSGIEYFGVLEKLGHTKRAKRGGHIPSARWVNWSRSLERDHTLKPAEELDEMFRAEGFAPDKEILTYCQSAARSGHHLFTLRLLGYDNVKNYDGSWQEWSDTTLPIENTPHLSKTTAGKLIALCALPIGVFAAIKMRGKVIRRLRHR